MEFTWSRVGPAAAVRPAPRSVQGRPMAAAGVGRTALRDVGPDRDAWSWGVRSTDPARERGASMERVGAPKRNGACGACRTRCRGASAAGTIDREQRGHRFGDTGREAAVPPMRPGSGMHRGVPVGASPCRAILCLVDQGAVTIP